MAPPRYNKRIQGVSRKALGLLMNHSWPGNVRELKTEVERAVLVCPHRGVLESQHFAPIRWSSEHPEQAPTGDPSSGSANAPPRAVPIPSMPLKEQVDDLERRAIQLALAESHGNKSAAARVLGITRTGLDMKMKRLGVLAQRRGILDL